MVVKCCKSAKVVICDSLCFFRLLMLALFLLMLLFYFVYNDL